MSTGLKAVIIATVAGATSVQAGIVSVGGSTVVAAPPADIRLNIWESSTETRVWAENSVVLASPMILNAVNTGLIALPGDAVQGEIAAGTEIASYMLRADPVGDVQVSLSGFVVFDSPILGVRILRGALDGSDALLGLPGVIYNGNTQRGLEITDPVQDSLSISPDRLRIDFSYVVGEWTDDIRIITAVPTPGSAAGALMGAAFLACRRRRTA